MHMPMTWRDCEILNERSGKPFHPPARRACRLVLERGLLAHVSVSDETDYVLDLRVVETADGAAPRTPGSLGRRRRPSHVPTGRLTSTMAKKKSRSARSPKGPRHAPVILDVAGTTLNASDRRRLVHPLTGGAILFGRNWSTGAAHGARGRDEGDPAPTCSCASTTRAGACSAFAPTASRTCRDAALRRALGRRRGRPPGDGAMAALDAATPRASCWRRSCARAAST
jgi:hypothetical protein